MINHCKKITLITYTPFWLESNGCQQRISGLSELLHQAKFKLDLIFVEQQQLITESDRRILRLQNRLDRVYTVPLAPRLELTRQYFLIKHWLKQMLPRRIVTFFESRKLTEAPETSSNGISSTGHFERMFNDYVRLRVQSSLKKSRPDAIIVVYADLGYVLDGLALNCLKVVDTIDVMHLQNKSYTKWGIEKPYIISQEEERTALKRFDIVIAIQDQEKIVFQKLCPDKQVITILPWLQVKRVSTKSNTEKNILFLGFNNSFNIHGINKFLAEIWPDVLLAQPEAKLLIGGKISGEIDASQYRNVECLGFFKDLDDFYRLGEITINPVVAGSGIKIKTLEALTRGKICISSSHSAEGLDTFIGHGLDIADTNEEFVTQLTKYMTDSNLRNMKIEDALNIARQTVSVENCLEPLLKYLN